MSDAEHERTPPPGGVTETSRSKTYRRVEDLMAQDRCVILDGGIATELQRLRPPPSDGSDPELWGTWAIYRAPEAVREVHERYVAAGCDVISTNTWSILSVPEVERRAQPGVYELGHWMDVARLGLRLARQAVEDAGRADECAVAFAISEDVHSPQRAKTLELLSRVFESEPPDLILLETLTLVHDPETYDTFAMLLETGLPVWLWFRRGRHGVCGVFGQHRGPPEGDLFGRAARRFEELGVGALLVNCLPIEHVPGISPGSGTSPSFRSASTRTWAISRARYGASTTRWAPRSTPRSRSAGERREPDHRRVLWHDARAHRRRSACARGDEARARAPTVRTLNGDTAAGVEHPARPWLDYKGRVVFPLPFPELVVDPGVFVPTQGSYLVWKHLFQTGIGEGARCLDVGCGSGILAIQLALNGAESVRAIDIDRTRSQTRSRTPSGTVSPTA